MLSQLFDGANLFVLPFWTLMIFLPKWDVTRKLISSPLPYITLAELYLYLLIGSIPALAIAIAVCYDRSNSTTVINVWHSDSSDGNRHEKRGETIKAEVARLVSVKSRNGRRCYVKSSKTKVERIKTSTPKKREN
jgi:hypothetical protein